MPQFFPLKEKLIQLIQKNYLYNNIQYVTPLQDQPGKMSFVRQMTFLKT